MTAEQFITRWQHASGSELANAQSFVRELAALLALPPTPEKTAVPGNAAHADLLCAPVAKPSLPASANSHHRPRRGSGCGSRLLFRDGGIDRKRETSLFALGRTDKNRLLATVFTLQGSRLRIISTRAMNRRERRVYAQAQTTEGNPAL